MASDIAVDAPDHVHVHTSGVDLCLDFANTVSWRGAQTPQDYLGAYADLVRWGEAHATFDSETTAALLQQAAVTPVAAGRVLRRAVALREAIFRIFFAQTQNTPPIAADLDHLNLELKTAQIHRRVQADGPHYVWGWETGEPALDDVLWRVAVSAADLLTSGELDRVRQCAGDECGWLFVDRSKNRSRRWCDMQDCGNRAKVRRYRRRQAGQE